MDELGIFHIFQMKRTSYLSVRTETQNQHSRFFIKKTWFGLFALVFLCTDIADCRESNSADKKPITPLVSMAEARHIFLNIQYEMRSNPTLPSLFDSNKGMQPVAEILLPFFYYSSAVEQISAISQSSNPEEQLRATMNAMQISQRFFEDVRTFLIKQKALSSELSDYKPDPFSPKFVEYSMRLITKDLSLYFMKNGIGFLWTGPPKLVFGELLLGDPGTAKPTTKARITVPLFELPKFFFIVEGRDEVTRVGLEGAKRTTFINVRQLNLDKFYREYLANPKGQFHIESGGPLRFQSFSLIAFTTPFLLKDQQESVLKSLMSKYQKLSTGAISSIRGPQTIKLMHEKSALELLPVIKPLLSHYEEDNLNPRYPHTRILMQHLYEIITCKLLVELTEGEPDISMAEYRLKGKMKLTNIMHQISNQEAYEKDVTRSLERISRQLLPEVTEEDSKEAMVLISMDPRFESLKSNPQDCLLTILLTLLAEQPWKEETASQSFQVDMNLYNGIIATVKKNPATYGVKIINKGLSVVYNADGEKIQWVLDDEAQIVIQLDSIIKSKAISTLAQYVREETNYEARIRALINKYRSVAPNLSKIKSKIVSP